MRAASLSALLVLLACTAPVLLPGVPLLLLLVPPVLAVLAGLSCWFDLGRTVLAVLLAGWVCGLVVVADGRPTAAVLLAGVALRLWAGVPELLRLGRPHLPALVPEVLGGVTVCVLVLVLAERTQDREPVLVLVAVGCAVLLAGAGAYRLRKGAPPSE